MGVDVNCSSAFTTESDIVLHHVSTNGTRELLTQKTYRVASEAGYVFLHPLYGKLLIFERKIRLRSAGTIAEIENVESVMHVDYNDGFAHGDGIRDNARGVYFD